MSLTQIQCFRVAGVLEDCCHQLDLLGHALAVQRGRERGFAPEQKINRLMKLERFCHLISQQMSKVSVELEEQRSFNSLLQAVEEQEEVEKEKAKKREREAELEQQRQDYLRRRQQIKDKRVELEKKQTQWQKLNLKCREKRHSEMQQKELASAIQTTDLPDPEVQHLEEQHKDEKKAHEEWDKFLKKQHEELRQTLNYCQQQTKQRLQAKQNQLDSLTCKKTLGLDRLMYMKNKFKEMEQMVMEDKREYKELQERMAQDKAASKIQTWWRAVTVIQMVEAVQKPKKSEKSAKKEGKKKKK